MGTKPLDFGFYCMDCLEGMKTFPDKYFDLAIVDPPYGIGISNSRFIKEGGTVTGGFKTKNRVYTLKKWDDQKPNAEYFSELFRVSKRQIVWGGNYFTEFLPPSMGFVIWDKRTYDKYRNNFADCEYAWLSPGQGSARIFRYLWSGLLHEDMKNKERRFHPTQKPAALYRWLISKYAKPGDIILDTHVGSASSLVACRETGHKYVGFEIDPEYYELAKERLDAAESQTSLFDGEGFTQFSIFGGGEDYGN